MSQDPALQAEPIAAELEAMVQSLSSISSDLMASYERLARRAERMEQELCIANAELERKVAEVEAILQALPVGVAVRDAAGAVTRVNDALLEILGASAEELTGAAPRRALPHVEVAGEAFSYERAAGDLRTLAWRSAPIGAAAGSVEVFDDQTGMAALEARVRQMDKMAALGNMAAGIAHEIRNPMNAIKGFADLFRMRMEPDTKDHRWATLISEGVNEVEGIITSMLSFSQPEQLSLETLEPREVVDAAVAAALQRTPGARAASAWRIDVECEAGALRGDRIKLRQAVRNLVSNALDVQPEGGRVRVRVIEERGQHVFSVEDAGPGIPAGLASRLVDPFFTTRAEGTGLGLSLVHTIAALHGGALQVRDERSELGGAVFKLTVPTSQVR